MSVALSAVEGIEYRLALIHPSSRTVLTWVGPDNAQRLPRICIPTNVRVTAYLHQTVDAAWDLRGVVLDYLPSEVDDSRCAIVELLSDDIPASLRPIVLDQIRDDDLSPGQRSSLLSLLSGEADSPLSRIGWLHEAIRWIEEASGAKISSICEIEQLNAGGYFALLRFPMRNGQSYWLKATGDPNKHERCVTLFLSNLCPNYIPEVLDAKPAWNAWIMKSHCTYAALPTDPIVRLKALRSAVVAMAEMQLRSLGHHAELLAVGAFDQRLNVLRSSSHALFECILEAMSRQTSTKAPAIDNARLHKLHLTFDALCDSLNMLEIPPMLLHGDMNTGNVLYDDGQCQFIDWCETYVGHPFVTLQHLLLLNQPEGAWLKSKWDAELIECYRAVMKEVLDPDAFDQAIASMPFMAAASSLYGRGDWLGSLSSLPAQRQARIRTLARYMDRAVYEPRFGAALQERLPDVDRGV